MKKYIAILFACVSFCACEDFLTQENPNKIESEYYFKDESSLEIYANGLTRSFATGIKNFVNGDKNEGRVECCFSTRDHSGAMVPVYAFGPGAEHFTGIFENTDVFKRIKQLLTYGVIK